MKLPKARKNMLKYALRNKLGNEIVNGVVFGGATKAKVYGAVLGRHPTKKGPGRHA